MLLVTLSTESGVGREAPTAQGSLTHPARPSQLVSDAGLFRRCRRSVAFFTAYTWIM